MKNIIGREQLLPWGIGLVAALKRRPCGEGLRFQAHPTISILLRPGGTNPLKVLLNGSLAVN